MDKVLTRKFILSNSPSTRYRGSKRRILPWIYENTKDLNFDTVFDAFSGTASVSSLFKLMGKEVTSNDIMQSNHQTAIAIIENNRNILNKDDISFLLTKHDYNYPSFIQDNFKDIYYLDEENKFLDQIITNIQLLSEYYSGDALKKKKAIAYHSLFQACISKRPYNLFHRKNLYMRTADVERSFKNKATWDRSFPDLFTQFANETSSKIFSNKRKNRALCENILEYRENEYDLVYLDPPYIQQKKGGLVNYYDLYHFLEGIMDYHNWNNRINNSMLHKSLIINEPHWTKYSVESDLEKIFKKFEDSIIVMSYGEPGFPSIDRIQELLLSYKSTIKIVKRDYTYSLNHTKKNGNHLNETLLIGE